MSDTIFEADREPARGARRGRMLITLFALVTIVGCRSLAGPLYDEVPESAPHAVLEFAKSDGVLALRASPIELSGAPPKYWKWSKFRIPVGKFRLLVGERGRADDCWTCPEPRYTCELTFEAEAGVTYSVALIEEQDGYSYAVTAPAGERLAACRSTGPDTIDRLVEQLRKSAEWASGGPADLFPRLDMPATADAEQLVAQLFRQQIHYLYGAETFRLLASRHVYVFQPSEQYLAVHLDTNLGERIVMFRFDERANGWWRSGLYLTDPLK